MSQDLDVRQDPGRAPVFADLGFWSVAGAAVAALSGSLDSSWGANRSVLVVLGLALLIAGPVALLALWRTRPLPAHLVRLFGIANLVLTPLVIAAAAFDVLSLTDRGNLALGSVAVVTLVLGAWQLARVPRGSVA